MFYNTLIMWTTLNKTKNSKFQDTHVQLVVWLPNQLDEQLRSTLRTLKKYGIRTTKSGFVRNAVFDRISQVQFLLSLMERKQEASGGEKTDE